MIVSNYEIGKEIVSGSFGTVNIAEDRGTAKRLPLSASPKPGFREATWELKSKRK